MAMLNHLHDDDGEGGRREDRSDASHEAYLPYYP